MEYSFHFSEVFRYWPLLLTGTINTMLYSLAGMLAGLAIGIVAAVMRNSPRLPLRIIAAVYVEVVRNTPLLVQLFIFFFALPSIGIRLSPITAAVAALVFNNGAYLTEIVRAGIENVHRSQREAAVSLGLGRVHVFCHVVLAQALDRVYPPIISQFILLMLSTSLISSIGADELTSLGSRIQSTNYRAFEVFIVCGVIYLGLTLIVQASSAVIARIVFPRRRIAKA